jgi:hypothetical protein
MDRFRVLMENTVFALSSPDHKYISVKWAMMERVVNGYAAIGFCSFQVNLAGTGQILLAEC